MGSTPLYDIPRKLSCQLCSFTNRTKGIFLNKKGITNLLPHQRKALSTFMYNHKLLIYQCNKHLDPSITETKVYVSQAIGEHLSDHITRHLLNTETVKPTRSKFAGKMNISNRACKVTDTHATKKTTYRVRAKNKTLTSFIPGNQTTTPPMKNTNNVFQWKPSLPHWGMFLPTATTSRQ